MNRFVLPAALVAAAAATAASADPVLDRVTSVVVNGRRLDVTVEATLAARGEIAIEGNVNAAPVRITRKARSGHRTYKLKIDARKFGLRALTTGLHFDLVLSASDSSGGADAKQSISATAPVPCILLPGFGNETTPGAFGVFAAALNASAGGVYTTTGAHPTLVVKEYPSQSLSLAALGKSVAPVVKKALKGTLFSKVDVVGYSYGGIVARSYLSQGGGASVRHCVFLATPNEGTPIAYVAAGLSDASLASLVGQNAALAAAAQQFLTPAAKQSLRNLYPTYKWASATLLGQTVLLDNTALELVLGSSSTPLTALNNVPPPAGAMFDAFFYTSTGVSQFGTVDKVDVTGFLAGTALDPAAIANGSGDGVAPAHSVTMDEVPAWKSVITTHDMGVGTHLTITADIAVISGIAAIVTQ